MLHRPILLKETLEFIIVRRDGVYLDGTCGTAGTSLGIMSRLSKDGKLVSLEIDPYALETTVERLRGYSNSVTVHGSYADIDEILLQLEIQRLDGAILDLGVSSFSLEDSTRGMSYRHQGALDMRFNPRSSQPSAAQLIEEMQEDELAEVLKKYGELAQSKKIARALKRVLPKTTFDYADIIRRFAPPGRREKTLAKAFQALRIHINEELKNLQTFLEKIPALLSAKARLAIITYHSLEDKLVKDNFRLQSTDCVCPPNIPLCICGHKALYKLLTHKPVTPSAGEIESNRRARSGKLRAVERL